MIEIPLTQGQITIIDDCDSDLAQLGWCARYSQSVGGYYASRNRQILSHYKTILMHRIILSRMLGRELARCELPDHINLDTLDNRRENLRLSTYSENKRNSKKHSDNKSGYKGVSWHTRDEKWVSQIQIEGKKKFLGYFDNIKDAAEAYKQAAIKYHGEFARWTED